MHRKPEADLVTPKFPGVIFVPFFFHSAHEQCIRTGVQTVA